MAGDSFVWGNYVLVFFLMEFTLEHEGVDSFLLSEHFVKGGDIIVQVYNAAFGRGDIFEERHGARHAPEDECLVSEVRVKTLGRDVLHLMDDTARGAVAVHSNLFVGSGPGLTEMHHGLFRTS